MTRPIQVHLDETDRERLEAFARERGWTTSHAVRVAVQALTRPAAQDPLLELSGDIDGLASDLSRHFDRRLAKTLVAEPSTVPRAPRARRTSATR